MNSLSAIHDKVHEMEVKYTVEADYATRLIELGFIGSKTSHQIDRYFIVNEQRKDGRHYLRLRTDVTKSISSLDYHVVKSELATEEIESDVEDPVKVTEVLEKLGLSVVCVVAKHRAVFEKDGVTVIQDVVEGLGRFIEIEILGSDENSARAELESVARKLNLLDSNIVRRQGYPDLILSRRRNEIRSQHVPATIPTHE